MKKSVKQPKKVYVGMSGGVDSSVSAYLLKKAGYEVTGVFIKVWQPDWIECTWKEERRDAMRAAAHLGIPFKTLDLCDEYKKGVIDYMISEYAAGRTPNPDIMCNKEVKFGAFMDWALREGADMVATGHYAEIIKDKQGSLRLAKGVDQEKDQSYFLSAVKGELLSRIMFPIGHLKKSEVRKIAGKAGLPNALKKDSQGLCFIGKIDFKEFLQKYVDAKPGEVHDERGKVIGEHPGAVLFTIGERHGFTITRKTPYDKPFFVTGKDVVKNILYVSNKDKEYSSGVSRRVDINRTNWFGIDPEINNEFDLEARARYRQPLRKVRVNKLDGDTAELEFKEDVPDLTPGQSIVLYRGRVCLGGGMI